MRTLLEWDDGAMEFDATKARGWELAAEVTEFPVEAGTAITDHVRPANGTITMEGVITNSPLVVPSTQAAGVALAPANVVLPGGGGARATLVQLTGRLDRRRVCDGILAGLVRAGTVVSLTTSLRTATDLAITRYKVDEGPETGQALALVLEFKQLRFATVARAAVPAVRRLQVPAQRGAQPAVNASAAERIVRAGAPPLRRAAERLRGVLGERGPR